MVICLAQAYILSPPLPSLSMLIPRHTYHAQERRILYLVSRHVYHERHRRSMSSLTPATRLENPHPWPPKPRAMPSPERGS